MKYFLYNIVVLKNSKEYFALEYGIKNEFLKNSLNNDKKKIDTFFYKYLFGIIDYVKNIFSNALRVFEILRYEFKL